jgi:serpin B
MRHTLPIASSALFLFALAGCSSGSSGPTHETDTDAGHSTVDSGKKTPASDAGNTATDGGGDTVTVNGQVVSLARSTKPRDKASSVSAADVTGAVTANNGFAVDLYSQLRGQSASDNLVSSPISASIALTMTYAGAQGTTATQMATAMHYGSAASTIFDGQNALSQALASRGPAALQADQNIAKQGDQPAPSASNYELQVVNSIWGQQTYTWNAPFLDIMAEDYGTGVYLQDFVHNFDPARVLINDWVSAETSNKINDLLPEGSLDTNTRMVLVNAVHLKLPWATPFDASLTANATFTTAAGTSVSAPAMNMTAGMSYVDDGKAQIVGLPFENGQVAVVIALPHGDLPTYEAGLTATSAGLAMPTGSTLVQLQVPKVSFTSPSFSLADALKTMGMPIAFDAVNADFSGLCTSPPDGDNLYIGDVIQKAMLAMQETGVEAAAATAVVVEGYGAAAPEDAAVPIPTPMIVNKPYVISIVDVPTGAVLFLGHIVDPTQAGSS